MPFGVTTEGFTRKPFTQIQSEMQAYVRAKISKHLQLTEKTGLGNVLNAASDQIAEAWEAQEASYHAFDKDNALDDAFVALCELTGTKRRGATKGTASTTCTFAGGVTYPPGALIAHVDGFPDNRWVNRDTIVTTTGGSYPVLFDAETAGAQGVALTGTLIRIAQPVTGWNTVTNAVDATPGQDIESIEALYVRREQELQRGGSGPVAAIRAAVSEVAGVVQVKSVENKTDYWTTIPPHSFRIIVWDGQSPAALNDEIAQALYDNAPGGIPTVGAYSGTAIDREDGSTVTVRFDRAAGVPVYIVADVAGSTAGVADAILAEAKKLGVGSTVIREKLKSAATLLPDVTDLASFTLGLAPAPVGTANLPMLVDQIPLFDLSRISVT